ncbi:MAG: transglutaminaseTgpA domain-containing protein [Lachnospiraceae bacterium]|nr:transglutaminaseTgpA domain-containing protein [Lachnospiraceae bacterium]
MTEYIDKWKNYIYRSLYTVVYCGIFLSVSHRYLGISAISRSHIIMEAFFLVLLIVFCALDKRGKLLVAAGVVAILSVIGLFYGFGAYSDFFREYVNWAVGREFNRKHLFFFQCFPLFGVALGSMLLAFLGEVFRPVRLLSFFAILTGAGIYTVYQWKVPKVGIAFLFVFILLSLSELVENYWKKERKGRGMRAYIVWLWPVWTLFFFLLLLTPDSPNPYHWGFVKRICSRVSENFADLTRHIGGSGGEDFSISMSGFAEESSLGGDVLKNRTNLLKVTSKGSSKENLYLIGLEMDTFDGQDWTMKEKENSFNRCLDTLETLYAVRVYEDERQMNYPQGSRLRVEYQQFRSEYFFMPGKSTSLKWEQTNLLDRDEQDNKIWNKRKRYRDTYDLTYYLFNGNREKIKELVNNVPDFDEEKWKFVCRKYGSEEVSVADLTEYRAAIYQRYCEKPVLSASVQNWVDKVTENCETTIDRLYGIESGLRTMKYTTTPGDLPKTIKSSGEFLDYMLLQKQEGYCTYFATAFVLLARAEGLPARFVKGFCVPMSGSREVYVTGDMAHAWAEVYFNGVGWVSFEPTPGYEEMLYRPWEEEEPVTENVEEIVYPEQLPPIEEEQKTESPAEEQKKDISEEEPEKGSHPLLVGFAIFFVLMLLIFLSDVFFSRRRYARSSAYEKFCRQAERTFIIASKLGIRRQDGETLYEFGIRLDAFLAESWENPPIFWRMYEDVLYGEIEVTAEMIEIAGKERLRLMKGLNRHNYLLERYHFLRRS